MKIVANKKAKATENSPETLYSKFFLNPYFNSKGFTLTDSESVEENMLSRITLNKSVFELKMLW